jgi:hypothetical protein
MRACIVVRTLIQHLSSLEIGLIEQDWLSIITFST